MKQFRMRFEEKNWYQPRLNFLTGALLPLSWVFGAATAVRRACYRHHILKSYRSQIPIIVVGNITVGGTGKTPCVIALAQYLTDIGYHPGIISRGVGRVRHQSPFLVTQNTQPEQAGDEAILLSRHSRCPVVLCVDRVEAARELTRKFPDCDVIISDDGLQHYRMERDIEIVVIDGSRYFGNGCLLPAGPLRESPSRLKEVDFVIVNGGDLQNASRMKLQSESLVPVQKSSIFRDAASIKNIKVHAVAGIGNPDKFFDYLRAQGFQIVPHVFADHHMFTVDDFNFGDDLPIIMTEKDAVKCEQMADERMWYLPVKAVLEEEFLDRLKNKLRESER